MITSVPFKVLKIGDGNHIVVKVIVNGRRANMLVDTGASETCFDSSRADKYSMHLITEDKDREVTGFGKGKVAMSNATIKRFELGNAESLDLRTVLLDMNHINDEYYSRGHDPLDGILGGDVLLNWKAQICYDKKTLKLKYKKNGKSK